MKGICRICGKLCIGELFSVWVKKTFTNFDSLCPGSIICNDCLFWFDESSTELAKIVGKEKPQRMRNYSHFIVDGKWIPIGKDKKAQMADIILNQDPEFVAISESGQKHIAFRVQPGSWQFEETAIVPNPELLRFLLSRIERILDLFSKTEIETGRYKHYRIIEFGFDLFRKIEGDLKQYRQSPYFKLALFLGQKDGQFREYFNQPNRADVESNSAGVQAEIFA